MVHQRSNVLRLLVTLWSMLHTTTSLPSAHAAKPNTNTHNLWPRLREDVKVTPQLKLKYSAAPHLKLRKKLSVLKTRLVVGADYDLADRVATFETTWKDELLGGDLSLKNLTLITWRRTWLFPGLTDAATKVEVRSWLNLQTGRADAEVKLGLRRRFSKKGLSLVHSLPLDGPGGRMSLALGGTPAFSFWLALAAARKDPGHKFAPYLAALPLELLYLA